MIAIKLLSLLATITDGVAHNNEMEMIEKKSRAKSVPQKTSTS